MLYFQLPFDVVRKLDALAKALNVSQEHSSSGLLPPHPPLPLQPPSYPHPSSPTLNMFTVAADDRRDDKEIEVRLSHTTVMKVGRSMIPDPPLISYAKDIAKLNRVWDDTSPFWSPTEVPFQIQEVPVALTYWKDLYAYGKTGHWKGTKSKWADWKVLLAPLCGHATVFVNGFSFSRLLLTVIGSQLLKIFGPSLVRMARNCVSQPLSLGSVNGGRLAMRKSPPRLQESMVQLRTDKAVGMQLQCASHTPLPKLTEPAMKLRSSIFSSI